MKGSDLDYKKILITGASGFVGSVLLRKIVTDYPKAKPIILLRKSANSWRVRDLLSVKNKIKVINGDIVDKNSLKPLANLKPDIIFHLAAYGAYPHQNDLEKAYKTNVRGTFNLIQVLERVNYKIFVNAGTSSEYGYKKSPMKETDVLEPDSYYATSKASSTLMLGSYARLNTRPIVTLRLFSVYGPYEEPTRFVPTLMRCLINGTDISVPNKPYKRDFVYVEDVVDAFLGSVISNNSSVIPTSNEERRRNLLAGDFSPFDALRARNDNKEEIASLLRNDNNGNDNPRNDRGNIFNICSGTQTSIAEMARLAVRITGSPSKIRRGTYPKRPWDTTYWVGDPNHTRNVLKWKATTSLEEGLKKTYEWHKGMSS